jgi:hypothetical protein
VTFDADAIRYIGHQEAVCRWKATNAGVNEDFKHGAGVAQRTINNGAAWTVPASADQRSASAIPKRMAFVTDSVNPHQAAMP